MRTRSFHVQKSDVEDDLVAAADVAVKDGRYGRRRNFAPLAGRILSDDGGNRLREGHEEDTEKERSREHL